MDEQNKNIVFLGAKQNSCLVRCTCCNSYQFSFKNIIMNFKTDQLDKFREIIMNDSVAYSEVPTYNNKVAMIRCSDENDIYLAFDSEEIHEIKELLADAYCTENNYFPININ